MNTPSAQVVCVYVCLQELHCVFTQSIPEHSGGLGHSVFLFPGISGSSLLQGVWLFWRPVSEGCQVCSAHVDPGIIKKWEIAWLPSLPILLLHLGIMASKAGKCMWLKPLSVCSDSLTLLIPQSDTKRSEQELRDFLPFLSHGKRLPYLSTQEDGDKTMHDYLYKYWRLLAP